MQTRDIAEADLQHVVEDVLQELYVLAKKTSDRATVLTLSGELGSGKTTFTQTLARSLGVNEVVTSPTFVVMKQYNTTDAVFVNLVHIDAYRIEDSSELQPLRFRELLATPDTLLCIEWPERIAEQLPTTVLSVSLTITSDTARRITYGQT